MANTYCYQLKVKVIPQQAEVAQGILGRLRPWIFLTFGTTRVAGHQPYAPAAFTPREIPGTHFQRLSWPQGTWFRRVPRKKSPVTPQGIDPGTIRLVVQCFNHYATPGPYCYQLLIVIRRQCAGGTVQLLYWLHYKLFSQGKRPSPNHPNQLWGQPSLLSNGYHMLCLQG